MEQIREEPSRFADRDADSGIERLLVGVCGASNVLNLAAYLMALRAAGPAVDIRVVLTRAAAAMLPPTSVRMICEQTYCDGLDELSVNHVALARWADRMAILPCTANMLSQAAHGLASGLLSSTLLAFEGPRIFFPCMNSAMWRAPSVRRSVRLLRADGGLVVEPEAVVGWEVGRGGLEANRGLMQPGAAARLILGPMPDAATDRPHPGSLPNPHTCNEER